MYSANQVRQFYVVNASHKATVEVGSSVEHAGDKFFSIKYVDNLGETQLVDIIENADIRKITVSKAPVLKARVATVSFQNAPATAGFEAYFTIVAPGFYGDTGENKEVFPVGKVFTQGTTAATVVSDFVSLINDDKNLKKYFKAAVGTNTTDLVITEVFNKNDYRLGVYQLHSVPFVVENGHYIDYSVENHLSDLYTPDLFTGVVYSESTIASDNIDGSYDLAQLEWFCHGFRGDVYREMAFPDNFPYVGLIQPGFGANGAAWNGSNDWYTCDIHYFWHGYGNQVDKSEKVLTFAGSSTDMNAFVTAFASSAGASPVEIPAGSSNNSDSDNDQEGN